MMKSLALCLLPCLLVATGTKAWAQERSGSDATIPSVEQWMSLKGASDPRISPDGRFVAYVQGEADWAADSMDREIWVAEIATRRALQLTHTKGSSWGPAWSPDGSRLLFLSDRGGSAQIYAVPAVGGDAKQLLNVETGVNAFVWSPDGRRLAYLTGRQVPESESTEKVDSEHVVGHEPKFTSALWLVNLPADADAMPAPTELLDGMAFAVDDPAWSPDSKRIAFTSYDYNAADTLDSYDIRVLRVADKSVVTVADRDGPDLWPVWAPDGHQIAFRTVVLHPGDPRFDHSFGYIAVAPSDGGPARILTPDFDERPTPVAWSPDGIYFSALQRTNQHLFRLDPDSGTVARVSSPEGSRNSGFSFSRDFRTAAFMRNDYESLSEVSVARLDSFRPRAITQYTHQIAGWSLGTHELVEWHSRDGLAIEGVLIKPPGFDPSHRYPLLVVMHGGPQAVDQPTYYARALPYPVEQFAARGALVLLPNYRGSVGYGQRFASALVRAIGREEYEDVIGGVDHLVALGIVDPDRVGAMGWSHGGYLAAFAATYGDRFRAISMGAGVSDFRHFYSVGGGAALAFERGYFVKPPWEDSSYYSVTAPASYISRAKTPLLIQHCENDATAPVVSAFEMYRGLRARNVPVELVLYRNCGHVPSSTLRQFRAATERNYEWFNRWIWGR